MAAPAVAISQNTHANAAPGQAEMSDADGFTPVVQIRILRNVADLVRTADLQQLTHRGVREWLRTHLELEAGTHYSKVAWHLAPACTPHAHP